MTTTFDILFEDNHLLVLNKPSGMPTQPHTGYMTSLEDKAKDYIKNRDLKKGNVFLHAIFRLDTNASGIVVFAKTQKALSRLTIALKNHTFEKEYVAIVERPIQLGEQTCYLIHGDHRAEIVEAQHPQAKLSKLIVVESQSLRTHHYLTRCANNFSLRKSSDRIDTRSAMESTPQRVDEAARQSSDAISTFPERKIIRTSRVYINV